MNCKDCQPYCTAIPDCLETLGVVLSEPDTEVTVAITDKFKNEYQWAGTTESSGLVILDLNAEGIPELLLNPFAGEFTLSARDINDELVTLTDGTNEFECVSFSVRTVRPAKSTHYIDPENKYPTYS